MEFNSSSENPRRFRIAAYIHPESPTPKPLRILKQTNQSSLLSRQQLSNNSPDRNLAEMLVRPQWSSSIHRYDNEHRHEVLHHEPRNLDRATSQVASIVDSMAHRNSAEYRETDNHDGSLCRGPETNALQSTPDSQRSRRYSDASSAILGDFVAVDAPKIARPSRGTSKAERSFNALSSTCQIERKLNPYEFEPGSPCCNLAYQDTLKDLIKSKNQSALISRQRHVKARRSEGNAIFMAKPNDSDFSPPGISRHMKRSESSPSLANNGFSQNRCRSPSPDSPMTYYGDEEEAILALSPSRGRQLSNSMPVRAQQGGRGNTPKIASCRHERACFDAVTSRSLARSQWEALVNQLDIKGSVHERHAARSPTRSLGNVMEGDDVGPTDSNSAPEPPKKRSRSPMKKMFGENGWLGRLPNEVDDLKASHKVSVIKMQSSFKKTGVMGMIKNKLDEFAEKADISVLISSRSSSEKHPKLSMLSVSLGPPEQARLHMEIELMMVVTANNYLMTQFSQGRIAVDSIKKIVDDWRSKGRPVVIEFMYDQATQRDLVAINQHNFRFHGVRAGDGIRINSMLYNWKQVAGLMAIRTFCNADTIILKLLFDIEQILELLGAADAIMFRLQHIRATVNESVRAVRQKMPFMNGREVSWNSQHPNEEFSSKHSMDDPYGGMKLVPDLYLQVLLTRRVPQQMHVASHLCRRVLISSLVVLATMIMVFGGEMRPGN